MKFDDINTLADIRAAMAAASSADGETSVFELKGTAGLEHFTRTEKRLLAKEICAFANTYGGILCFHCGGNDNVQGFTETWLDGTFDKLEDWSASCLEPRLAGIRIKKVGAHF